MADYLPDLESTCSALGTNDGAGSYHKDDDCLECVKDLIRFLRRDDGNNHTLRRALGQIGVVNSDLLPILREYPSDDDLFDMVLRLVVNLTSPELLLFKQELPEDKLTRNYFLQLQRFRQDYKRACVNEKLWHVLAQKLGGLLRKDFDERSEDDRLIIERILILVRNILEVPRDASSEKRTENDATVHDQILWVLHKSGMEDLLLYISSSADEAQYCLHVVEIISLMFREQDPKFLAAANYQRSMEERKEDETALIRLKKQEEEKKKEKHFQTKSSRHSRFGGSYTITNMKSISENPMIYHKPLSSLHNINFDENKRPKKISKNRETPKDDCKRRSTLAIRLFLKEFCIEFLNGAYNQLMYVVKDNLNRQKAQQNDETYYLWALKFFMEFNRLHNFRVELVSETMSKSTFHYIHQQIEAYKDHYEHEKRNRPMCLTWARRMHLAIKAYQELLWNLVDMSKFKDEDVRKSASVLRTDVFYEPEYRELCLQQLNIFIETKMSLGYLKDLVETTHIFLKLMEAMSKSNHLVVRSKKLKKSTKGKQKSKVRPPNDANLNQHEQNEIIWEGVSSQLSACVQGKVELPTNISPFDAASNAPIDDQKLSAIARIQQFIRQNKAAKAVVLLRVARDVWPENDTFGESNADPEDEFMALREILFSELPTGDNLPSESDSSENDNPLDNIEQGEVDDEDDEDNYVTHSREQEFNFKGFILKFAIKNICSTYALLFQNYQNNSEFTNHCIVKMFHRISWECGLPGMLFNISIFRTFQRVHNEYKITKVLPLKEIDRFSSYLLSRFFDTSKNNKKVFIEMLFWNSNKEASEILEGYGSQARSTRNNVAFWTEDEEEALGRIFYQLKEASIAREQEPSNTEEDLLDSITAHFASSGKSRRQVAKKLRDTGLINDIREISNPKKSAKSNWTDDEKERLEQIFYQLKEASTAEGQQGNIDAEEDLLDSITAHFASSGKSRRQVANKLKDAGLINNIREISDPKKTNKGKKKDEVRPVIVKNMSQHDLTESIWKGISLHLSACVQGKVDLPANLSPFDTVSETPIDDQKMLSIFRIQQFIRQNEAAKAVTLLRAARDVWPENDTFGEADADPEEEFMALREILFYELPITGDRKSDSGSSDDNNPIENPTYPKVKNTLARKRKENIATSSDDEAVEKARQTSCKKKRARISSSSDE